jgi:hypothetical protein
VTEEPPKIVEIKKKDWCKQLGDPDAVLTVAPVGQVQQKLKKTIKFTTLQVSK